MSITKKISLFFFAIGFILLSLSIAAYLTVSADTSSEKAVNATAQRESAWVPTYTPAPNKKQTVIKPTVTSTPTQSVKPVVTVQVSAITSTPTQVITEPTPIDMQVLPEDESQAPVESVVNTQPVATGDEFQGSFNNQKNESDNSSRVNNQNTCVSFCRGTNEGQNNI